MLLNMSTFRLQLLVLYLSLFLAGLWVGKLTPRKHSCSKCGWNTPLSKEESVVPDLGQHAKQLESQILQGLEALEIQFSRARSQYQKNHQDGVAVCAVFRDEAPYLKEWIEYHRLLGIDTFYLMNNLSEDDFFEVLVPYVVRGIVTLKSSFYRSYTLQPSFYKYCTDTYAQYHKWIFFMDLDEFIVPLYTLRSTQLGTYIPEFLKRYEKFAVRLDLPRREFCSNGHDTKPNGTVIENYTLRKREVTFYKSGAYMRHPSITCEWTPKSVHHCFLASKEDKQSVVGGLLDWINPIPMLQTWYQNCQLKARRGSARLRDAKFDHFWDRQHEGCVVHSREAMRFQELLMGRLSNNDLSLG